MATVNQYGMIVFVEAMEVKLHSYIVSALDGDEWSVVAVGRFTL